MLDETGLIVAEGIGEASRITREAILKSASVMADQLERDGAQMTPAQTLRFFVDIVTNAWEIP